VFSTALLRMSIPVPSSLARRVAPAAGQTVRKHR